MDLADVALFRMIAVSGSLSAAARQLGLTPMAVSRRLAALEAQVGARLFHRTTRVLSLTPEGEAFLPFAGTLLETQDQALATLASSDSGLSGILKVTAPNVIGHSIVVPTAAELMNENPSLRVDLTLTDGVVDIAASGLDIAIRVAPLQASNLIATRLADNPRVLCASPAYIRNFGKPLTTGDLTGHSCLLLHGMDDWPFVIDGKLQRVPVSGRFAASTVDAIRAACISGSGLALMTYWDVWNELDLGRLERIELADAVPDELGIWGILPSRSYIPPRVRALTVALKKRLSAAALRHTA